MAKKKNILTEDLFNSNGNTQISDEVLNESVETVETEEIVENENIENNNNIEEIVKESEIETNEVLNDEQEDVENEDNIYENEIKEDVKEDEIKEKEELEIFKPIVKTNVNQKIGFNDEAYYYGE